MPNAHERRKARRARQIENRSHRAPEVNAPDRWFEVRNFTEDGRAEIKLRGYIGYPKTYRDWWTGEEVEDPEAAGTLAEFEAELESLGDVSEIQLTIFSQGGDAFTGLAIHNLLRRHPAHKVCVIDGLCASAATHPAMACDEIRIPSNAFFLIHQSTWGAVGTADDLAEAAKSLRVLDNSLADLYAARSGSTRDQMLNQMRKDRWLSGAEAVEMGLADTLIEPLANLASRAGSLEPTNEISLRHAPAAALAFFDMRRGAPDNLNADRGSRIAEISELLNQPENTMPEETSTPSAPAPAENQNTPAPAPAQAPAPENANASQPAPAESQNAPAPAPAPAPENQGDAQPPQPQAAPAPAPAPAPANDFTAAITAAVGAALAPINQRLDDIENRQKHGVDPANLSGTQPAAGANPESGEGDPKPVINFEDAKPMSLISVGVKNMQQKIREARSQN